jgi:hypothetical protein
LYSLIGKARQMTLNIGELQKNKLLLTRPPVIFGESVGSRGNHMIFTCELDKFVKKRGRNFATISTPIFPHIYQDSFY